MNLECHPIFLNVCEVLRYPFNLARILLVKRLARLSIILITTFIIVLTLFVLIKPTGIPIINQNFNTVESIIAYQNKLRISYYQLVAPLNPYINLALIRLGLRVEDFISLEAKFPTEVDAYAQKDSLYSYIVSSSRQALTSNKWDWSAHPISADVLGVEADLQLLGLTIVFPDDRKFSNVHRTYSIACTTEETIVLTSQNFEVSAESASFFENVNRGDKLYAFCEDPECTSLGKACAIVSLGAINE